jgi:hypothetical protein
MITSNCRRGEQTDVIGRLKLKLMCTGIQKSGRWKMHTLGTRFTQIQGLVRR